MVTVPVQTVWSATPQARIVRIAIGQHRFDYCAGQWALVGAHGRGSLRPYSIASAPEETVRSGCLEFLIKVSTNGIASPHVADLRSGALVDIEGPFGSFQLPRERGADELLFIAGGIGIAAVRSMVIEALHAPRATRMSIVYSARTPLHFAYADDLARLARERRVGLLMTASRSAGARWTGQRGRITPQHLSLVVRDPNATQCLLCGPLSMLDDLHAMLLRCGFAAERIRSSREPAPATIA